MENYDSLLVPPETTPDVEPTKKKSRRKVFELFKKPEETAVTPEAKQSEAPEKSAETTPEPRRRRLGAELLRMLRGEKPAAKPQMSEQATPTVPESLPEPVALIERAKDMGRGVLRLLGRVRTDVHAADAREAVGTPTDITPLIEADNDVQAAMQELIAPIMEYQAEHPAETTDVPAPETSATPIGSAETTVTTSETAPTADPEYSTPVARPVETIATVASTAAEMLASRERRELRVGRVRRLGLLAIGAATAGTLVYTLHRQRQLRKEQRALRKEFKRFELEVRAHQAAEEQRLHQLQETTVERLSQPERQQYVQEVSTFAHERADEIRSVARQEFVIPSQEGRANTTPERPTVDRPVRQERTPAAERLAAPAQPEVRPATAERGIIERLANVVTGAKNNATSGGSVGGNMLVAGTKFVDKITRSLAPVAKPQSPARTKGVVRYTQTWLLGAAFGLALLVFLLILAGIL